MFLVVNIKNLWNQVSSVEDLVFKVWFKFLFDQCSL